MINSSHTFHTNKVINFNVLLVDKKCNYECSSKLFLNERLNSLEKFLKMSFIRTLNEKYIVRIE